MCAPRAPAGGEADGLAAGKGVTVASTTEQALMAVRQMMRDHAFGDAGNTVVIEELLPVKRRASTCSATASARCPCRQRRIKAGARRRPGPQHRWHGRLCAGAIVTPAVHERVMRTIVEPTLPA